MVVTAVGAQLRTAMGLLSDLAVSTAPVAAGLSRTSNPAYSCLVIAVGCDCAQHQHSAMVPVALCCRSELFSYTDCVGYAVLTSLVSLERVPLKSRVVDSPEIRSVIGHVPALETCLNALYDCKYKDFFKVSWEGGCFPQGVLGRVYHARVQRGGVCAA